MRKNFTFLLPDEPYKNTTALNKVQNAVYTGPRYLAICVIDATGEIKYVARRGESLPEIDFETLVDDDPATTFYLIDAGEHPFAAAYLMNSYETGDVPDYSTALVDADGNEWDYSYHYDDGTGAIGQCFYGQSMKYINNQFVGPEYRLHAITKASMIENYLRIATMIENSIQLNDYSEEDEQALADHVAWLRDLERRYAGIDHWKIPFPTNLPNYY
jgi:hypothetical protein